ncbi:MAG TPA: ABC transporter permease subunit [Chloroflexota bacterium]|jgi:osmoprotectant transport system permease protein|nr:ABC transporter permease subunit [Chloroflexota bacterium]
MIDFLGEVANWVTSGSHWVGSDGIPNRIGEHLLLSATITLVAVAIALPIGVMFGHTGRGGFVAINIANLGRAMPSLALLALAFPLALSWKLGFGFWPTFLALVPLGIPPVLTNSYVAVREVDRDVVEAARGMGLRERQVLRSVEIPIAMPIILAGIRNAAVAIVATATLGALVAGGGLGRYLVDGLARQEYPRMFVGAVLVALLAICVEVAFGIAERLLVSEGVRGRTQAEPQLQELPR